LLASVIGVTDVRGVQEDDPDPLKLEDGPAGQLRIDTLTPDDSDKVRVMFVGEGSLG
jgi:hypothetical protein